MPANSENGRNLSAVVAELKEESKEFVSTRLSMLRAEMNQKLSAWKSAAPMLVIGLVLLGTSWLLLTAVIVSAIYVAFQGNPWAMCLAFAITFVLYAAFGAIAAYLAIRNMQESGIIPKRTLRVLKDDQVWIANEARVQL